MLKLIVSAIQIGMVSVGRAQLTVCIEPSIHGFDKLVLTLREQGDVGSLADDIQEPRAGNLIVSARTLHN
jgi:hypothetical protein